MQARTSSRFEAWDLFEWDGAGSLLYPWWWDSDQFDDGQLELVKRITHPDLAREVFLRASWGSAQLTRATRR